MVSEREINLFSDGEPGEIIDSQIEKTEEKNSTEDKNSTESCSENFKSGLP